MQKIIPHLWFDKEAKEASAFYVSIFPNAKIESGYTLHDTPSGDCDVVNFSIEGFEIGAMSAGPYFKLNPSCSFMLNFDPGKDSKAKENLTALWEKLMAGGKALMPLQEYPFSKWYGWVQDKYGVSWQLILTDPTGEERPFIMPSFLFFAKAKEATEFWLSVFKDAKRGVLAEYPDKTVMFTDFILEKQWLTAMDSPQKPDFDFTEAFSFIIRCQDQAEMDYYTNALSAVPESEQCGWVKDKFGISWQMNPIRMEEMMREGTREQIDRVTQAFMPMKRLDLATLEKAYKGE